MPSRLSLSYCGLSVWVNPKRCHKCNRTINRETAQLHSNDRPGTPLHLSRTSDGFFVASRTFTKFAVENAFEGVEFYPLLNSRSIVKISRKVEYAVPDEELFEQDGWCDECKTFRSALVRHNRDEISKAEKPIGPMEIVESRVRIGTELTPSDIGWTTMTADMIVGTEVEEILRKKRFRRLSFERLKIES